MMIRSGRAMATMRRMISSSTRSSTVTAGLSSPINVSLPRVWTSAPSPSNDTPGCATDSRPRRLTLAGRQVEAAGADVGLDRQWDLEADRLARPHAATDLPRRDADQRHRDEVDAVARRRNLLLDARDVWLNVRARGDAKLGQGGDAVGLVPGGEVAQGVAPHQEEEPRWSQLRRQQREGVGREGETGAIVLGGADLEVGDAGQREA